MIHVGSMMIGNKHTGKLHRKNCYVVKMITLEHIVHTETGEGFVPCKICFPYKKVDGYQTDLSHLEYYI
jgi:hypothetical protein